MIRFSAVILVLGLVESAWPAIVEDSIVVHDPQRPQRAITAVGVHDTAAAAPLPLVVLAHATATPATQYQATAHALAARGLLVVLPTTEVGLPGDQDALADDMVVLATAVLNRSAELPASWPEPSGRWALAGHSLGGGAAVLAATRSHPQALVLMAPQERARPSMIVHAGDVTAPVLILSGSMDCLTPPADHHEPLHAALNATPRILASLIGGGHCGFATPCEPCSGAETGCPPLLSAATMQALTLALAGPWLDRWLQPDIADWTEILNALGQPLVDAQIVGGPTHAPTPPRWRLRSLSASPTSSTCRWRLEGPITDPPVVAHVYDLRGRRMSAPRLVPAGDGMDVIWEGRDASAGVYLLRVLAGRTVLTGRTVRLP